MAIGILVAVLADKLSRRGESIAKSIIFLPMAISFVGASAIWGLIYDYSTGKSQTGLLNAIWDIVGEPQTWLQVESFKLNCLLLMVIVIWLQVGFAMILMSSAIKGVPEDTIEAARIDGATEWQIFWRVVIPQIKGTTITVFITVLILVLKIFDIVYVLTNGAFDTNVIANLFFFELFKNQNAGTRLGDRRDPAARGHPGADLPGPALPRRGGELMTDRMDVVGLAEGRAEQADRQSRASRRRSVAG